MLEKLLETLARNLNDRRIPYMIIGGQAVLVHGEPRLTKDIDITLGIAPDDWRKIQPVIESVGLKILVDNPDQFVTDTFVLPTEDPVSVFRVDFIFSITPYEREAIQRANSVKIGKTKVRFANVEDLIIHKIFAGRPRDIEDVKHIILKNPGFDKEYVLRWLKDFDRSLSQNFTSQFLTILKNIGMK